jgi:hypothetical protein
MFDPFTGFAREAEPHEGDIFAFDHRFSERKSRLGTLALLGAWRRLISARLISARPGKPPRD